MWKVTHIENMPTESQSTLDISGTLQPTQIFSKYQNVLPRIWTVNVKKLRLESQVRLKNVTFGYNSNRWRIIQSSQLPTAKVDDSCVRSAPRIK